MNKSQARTRIIQIAAMLVQGKGLPSSCREDHKQSTYSAWRVAKMAAEQCEWQKEIAVELRDCADVLANSDAG